MRITIQHQTRYDYSEFTQYAIQRIYLTPRDDAHSRILRWEITGDGELSHRRDETRDWRVLSVHPDRRHDDYI